MPETDVAVTPAIAPRSPLANLPAKTRVPLELNRDVTQGRLKTHETQAIVDPNTRPQRPDLQVASKHNWAPLLWQTEGSLQSESLL